MGWSASTRRRGELDIDQRAQKRIQGSLSENRPEDKAMGRGASVSALDSILPFTSNRSP